MSNSGSSSSKRECQNNFLSLGNFLVLIPFNRLEIDYFEFSKTYLTVGI